jgi:peptide/nickel transport system substrate-binding protein
MKTRKESGGKTRREFLYWSGVGMAGLALGGGSRSAEAQDKKPKYGGVLRAGGAFASAGLDAHKNQDFADYTNYCLIYGGLTEIGKVPQVEIHPMLAKSWEISQDGREYIFNLRQGIKFHHGKELDSGDVKYSIERVLNPATRSPRAFALRWIDSVNVMDKYNLKINLKESFGPFLSNLTIYNCAIIPAGWEPTGTKPAPGTGPYFVKSFVPNETIEFKRFDQYWETHETTGDRLPYIDTIVGKKIVDETVRWTAFRAGELESCYAPPMNILAKAILEKPLPGFLMDYESLGCSGLWFNLSKPPFNDKRVRQAVAYAIDKKKVMGGVFWGLGETVNNQPFLDRSRLFIPVKDREPDLAKAKQLMAEAGFPNGFKTEILAYSLKFDMDTAEVAIGQLQKIGIEATMKVIDRAAFYPMLRRGEFSLASRGVDERFDWDDAYYMYFHSNEVGKNNYPRYSNKELDALLDKGRRLWKHEDRKQVYRSVVETIRDDVPLLYLYKTVVGYAFHDYVKGFRKGFATRYAWHQGGAKYWWLDK